MKHKRLFTLSGLTLLGLVLSGCVRTTKSGKPYGIIYDYLAKPMQHFMEWLAGLFGGNYGLAIIALNIIIRLILFPIMFNQMKKSTMMQERMSKLQPHLKKLQERQKNAKTPEEQALVGQQMMSFYRDNNVSLTGGIGCLPLLIQLPIFAALYAAIRYSPELSSSPFFGIPLGKPSIIMALLAFVTYAIQGVLSLQGIPQEQKAQMRSAMFISPIMILFISWTSSAGLGLYFFAGGIFAILQTVLINLYRPRIRKQIEEELKANPIKVPEPVQPATPKPDVQSTIDQLRNGSQPKTNSDHTKGRNAGKQQNHKS